MKLLILSLAALVVGTTAQIPSLGFCPEYLPKPDFDMERFTGIWYESERYFQLVEVASRCVMSNYTKGPDGKFYVLNEVTSRFTGIKRILEGEIKKPLSKAEQGKLHVKYTSVPFIPLETQYNVLDTDYDNYAVMWSCSGIGPVHTQNAWIMTRQRVPPGEILQKAYGVLDKHKISKVFFVKTNQEDCLYLDNVQAEQAANRASTTPRPTKVSDEASEEEEEIPNTLSKSAVDIRAITPDAPEIIIQTRKAEEEAKEKKAEEEEKKIEKQPVVEAPIPIPIAAPEETAKTVPEVIMKIAEEAAAIKKEVAKEPVKVEEAKEPIIEPVKEETKVEEEPKEKSATPVAQEKKLEVVEEKIEIVKP